MTGRNLLRGWQDLSWVWLTLKDVLKSQFGETRMNSEYRPCKYLHPLNSSRLLTTVCLEEHFNILIGSSCQEKHKQRIIIWAWYSLRNYLHYSKTILQVDLFVDKIPFQIYIHICMVLFLQQLSSRVNKKHLDSIN